MRWWLCLGFLPLLALPVASQVPPAPGVFGDAPYDEALDFVDLLAAGDFFRAAQCLPANQRGDATVEQLKERWGDLTRKYGRFQGRHYTAADLEGARWRIHVLCTFERGYVDAILTFSTLAEERKVLSFAFVPVTHDQPIGATREG
ncbi:MAG: hypothetical protein WBS54_02220 [Acidobacteriota bacterium]